MLYTRLSQINDELTIHARIIIIIIIIRISREIKWGIERNVEWERSRSFPHRAPTLSEISPLSEQRFGRRIDQRNCQVDVGDGGSLARSLLRELHNHLNIRSRRCFVSLPPSHLEAPLPTPPVAVMSPPEIREIRRVFSLLRSREGSRPRIDDIASTPGSKKRPENARTLCIRDGR